MLVLLCALSTAAVADPLQRLHWLQGSWSGTGEHAGVPVLLQRDIVCALGCRYLNVEARQRQADQTEGEPGSLLALWTYHPGRQRLLLHVFDDFAALTTYVEDPAAGSSSRLVLVFEDLRDGSRRRVVYELQPPDAFVETLEHAGAGEAWQLQLQARFRRDLRPRPALR